MESEILVLQGMVTSMKLTKQQLKQIIREELLREFAAPMSELKNVILTMFLETGEVTTADVTARMRADNYDPDEIDAAIEELAREMGVEGKWVGGAKF